MDNKRVAIIGGTFDALHEGHKEYIKTAFEFADIVYIMLNSDRYAKKSYRVKTYKERCKNIIDYLSNLQLTSYEILEMNDLKQLISFCLNNNITLAVVEPKYYFQLQNINDLRVEKKLNPFYILVKRRGKDKNGNDLSSTVINLKG